MKRCAVLLNSRNGLRERVDEIAPQAAEQIDNDHDDEHAYHRIESKLVQKAAVSEADAARQEGFEHLRTVEGRDGDEIEGKEHRVDHDDEKYDVARSSREPKANDETA